MNDEIPATPLENPPIPSPAPAPTIPANNPAQPPATRLVVTGEKSEREIQLEAQLEAERAGRRTAETIAAEKEREVQELKKIPATPAPKKEKRWRLPSPVIGSDEDEE